MKYHQDLTQERWNKFNLFEQMANIGSEIVRAISWRKRDSKLSKLAFERGLELIDLTIADSKNRKRLKEICRVRETLVDYLSGENIYHSTDQGWQNYFYAFNYAARLKTGV